MSTKNLRKMLDHYRRITGFTGAGFAPREIQLIDAIQELEAIERERSERCSLAEAIAEGDKDALERLAQMACDERNAAIKDAP